MRMLLNLVASPILKMRLRSDYLQFLLDSLGLLVSVGARVDELKLISVRMCFSQL